MFPSPMEKSYARLADGPLIRVRRSTTLWIAHLHGRRGSAIFGVRASSHFFFARSLWTIDDTSASPSLINLCALKPCSRAPPCARPFWPFRPVQGGQTARRWVHLAPNEAGPSLCKPGPVHRSGALLARRPVHRRQVAPTRLEGTTTTTRVGRHGRVHFRRHNVELDRRISCRRCGVAQLACTCSKARKCSNKEEIAGHGVLFRGVVGGL